MKLKPAWQIKIAFLCGWVAMFGTQMGMQDSMGLETYLEFARENWIELSPMVGYGITFIGLFVCSRLLKRLPK